MSQRRSVLLPWGRGPTRRIAVGIRLFGGLLAASTVCLAGCAKDPPPDKKPAPEVTVGKPIAREVTDYFEFPGSTEAVSEVEIRARVTGYITKVNFEDGQEVKACQVLFEIDPRPYEAMLDRAKGELALLEATQEKAQADLARSERLRPSGAVSEDEYEQHVAKLKKAKASIDSAKAAVTQAALGPGVHQDRLAHRRPGEQGADQGGQPGAVGRKQFRRAHHRRDHQPDLRLFQRRRACAC